MSKNPHYKSTAKKPPVQKAVRTNEKKPRKPLILPILPLFFLMVWAWATVYYGDVFRIARENSFWVASTEQMKFILDQSYGMLWYVGRLALQLFRYPFIGGMCFAGLLALCSWLLGYSMRLTPRWRWIQYIPALLYVGYISKEGINVFFEAETGRILGIPLLALGILLIWAVIIKSFSKKEAPAIVRIPKDETPMQNRLQLCVCILGLAGCITFTQQCRPYVPVITKMMVGQINQDWEGIQKTARANADLSYRAIAAYYAMALVQTDQVGDRVYDIRMDYDTLHIVGWDNTYNNGNSLYIPEGNYYAGLVETCYHYTFEKMVMNGPSSHGLEMLVKCALMRNEWALAEKYIRILRQVPFEGDFCDKYGAMIRNPKLVNADPEMANIRQLEPLHDSFENLYQQPTFMGYNLRLYEARSINAWKNSLAVCLYTKLMPDFLQRLQPLAGSIPPENFADGILLMTNKYPELNKMFNGLDFRATRMSGFMQEIQPFMKDRPGFAKELFPKYKGYYPYYYFFGNLKATKKPEPQKQTSNSGVN
ncbi:MAG: DUF6057 family protein [Bacteroidaceae bacterium]|nr:DUF6057 family protein [Bacteroidaceae bacterium]